MSKQAKIKNTKVKGKGKHQWNLSLLYSSANDPQIEKDVAAFETEIDLFAKRYDAADKAFLKDDRVLLEALKEYEKISANPALKAFFYFHYAHDMDARDTEAAARLALLENKLMAMMNKMAFFVVELGKVSVERQNHILSNSAFSHFKVFLQRIFDDAKHLLSVKEEQIMNLKSQPAHSMWVSANERILNVKTVAWKGKALPGPAAMQLIPNLKTVAERKKLAKAVAGMLKSAAPFAEAEINAVFTDKKIDDGLRGFSKPYEATVLGYRNDPKAIEQLRATVMDHVGIAHDFYTLKAKLLGQKTLGYFDRAAKIGHTRSKYSFEFTAEKLQEIFGGLDPRFKEIMRSYLDKGQIDVFPRVGKHGGAYCSSSFSTPVFLLLNHTNDLRSFTTAAHELGHAFHSELSRGQGALYSEYSISLAETASTLFETIASNAVYESLPDKEKAIFLHDSINEDIATIFRQIACFNFELDLHSAIRAKGYLSKEEIADLHNKNMLAYLGPAFKLEQDDGYMFVTWSHIRNFFYVYTYAYGLLVSKALLRRYKKDPSFWKKIEKFLSAGGKDSPENILKEIGIDVSSSEFWKEGLMEIADDIKELERLTHQSGKKKGK
jgi:oligoendopeptidase F